MRDLIAIFRLGRGAPQALFRRHYDQIYPLLRPLAVGHRRLVLRGTRIVAVVGSLGKTTTTALLRAALDTAPHSFSFSNYGTSLARNLLRIDGRETHAVLEVGIAGPGPMPDFARMLRPDIVVVTSIASDHNRSLPTLEITREEKVAMVRALRPDGLAVLNGDDPNVRWMATQTVARVVTIGAGADNDLRATELSIGDDRTSFLLHLGGSSHRVHLRVLGPQAIYPMLAAAAVAHAEGLDLEAALARASAVEPPPSRMEITDLPDGTRVIDDSFKGSIESMHVALDALAALRGRRRIVVLGPVEEPQGPQGDIYRDLGARLARSADLVICTGGRSMSGVRTGAVAAGMEQTMIHLTEPRIEEIAVLLDEVRLPGDVILVKGASAMRLGRLAEQLKGRTVSCRVKRCRVKVASCGSCPFIDAPDAMFDNRYVRRLTER